MPVINRYSGSTMNIKEISISNNKKKQILAAARPAKYTPQVVKVGMVAKINH